MHVSASKHPRLGISRFAIIGLIFLAITAGVVSAQDTTSAQNPAKKKLPPYALIFGTVWDAQNHPVYGVPVKIRRADQKKAKWELMSDHQGEFAQRVPAGKADYIVWAEVRIKGKKGIQKTETTAHIENDERIDIALHLTE